MAERVAASSTLEANEASGEGRVPLKAVAEGGRALQHLRRFHSSLMKLWREIGSGDQ